MRILVVGDPHGSDKAKNVPLKEVDLILITGDLGKADLMRKMAFESIDRKKKGLPEKEYTAKQEKRAFMQAYTSSMKLLRYYSRFAPVYVIFGNVESSNAETRRLSKKIKIKLPLLAKDLDAMENVRVLNNRVANFRGLRIGGLQYFIDTSWVKEFKPFEYKDSIKKAKKETDKARRTLKRFGNLDILLCHQPPYGILDKVNFPGAPKHWQNKHAGSKAILDYIKKKHPRYVFCGHIHEAKGKKRVGMTLVQNIGVAGDYVLLDF
ncbi:MAG TPA: metallophosphoesterase [Candidatus Nanoarchaeia archaeon]|nr:metallophosphoesterase [Candidatus Nanoarchaeia archaeon]